MQLRLVTRCQALHATTQKRLSKWELSYWRRVAIPSPLPRHLAVCMDGNRRWAVKHGLPIEAAYLKAESVAASVVASCQLLEIEALTLFAFSAENWKRDPTEVTLLTSLLQWGIQRRWRSWKEQNLRVRFIGDRTAFSTEMQELMEQVEHETEVNTGLILTIALSYGGRQDLLQSVKSLLKAVQKGDLAVEDLTEAALENGLQTKAAFAEVRDPDLFMRTSGERRLSNFILWDMAYTELHFESALWPDFSQEHLWEALRDFSQRERRFGR